MTRFAIRLRSGRYVSLWADHVQIGDDGSLTLIWHGSNPAESTVICWGPGDWILGWIESDPPAEESAHGRE